jgi:hypothetical protein
MFAPIMIGMADPMSNTPPPTIPTTMEVVEDDDWITEVAKTPIKKPTNGLAVVSMRLSAKPRPTIFSDVPIKSRLKMKQ